jgi:phospholipid/cholesterol/gamma-HCH transport system ATP-binding protein
MTDQQPLAIEVNGLVKNYHGLRPLRVRELQVRAGALVAIAGLDAAAAEVFVNILNGAILPDEGEVRLFGRLTREIRDEAEWFALLNRIGIVTSRAVLLEGSSVRQNLALPFTLDIDDLPGDIERQLVGLADLVGIPREILDSAAGSLPAHARMRIRLARALAMNPALLLLEHPTAAVERDAVVSLADTVRDVATARRLTLIAITEDALLADRVAQTTLTLRAGTGRLVRRREWRRWG